MFNTKKTSSNIRQQLSGYTQSGYAGPAATAWANAIQGNSGEEKKKKYKFFQK